MALNKNALIRYKTIDKCLQNQYKQWTLDSLIEACSDALYEYEGRDINVSKRTVQLDIQMMRGDKLGYNAPIEVYDKKFYHYAEDDYSITNIPITESDMNVLAETVEMLKQFKDFSLFAELGGIIQKLEDKVYSETNNQSAIIHLDKNDGLKGLEHLDTIYQSILKKIVLKITYKSFKAREASDIIFHPYILKEFNNRWFVVGVKNKEDKVMTFALDRINKIDYSLDENYRQIPFNGDDYYKDTVGVSVLKEEKLETCILKFDRINAPYVLTKPFHHSQQVIEQQPNHSVTISVRVHHNFEFERLILGFGDSCEVIAPNGLRRRIKGKLKKAVEVYMKQNNL
jgi:predicted DNA-binding transcriptional regulator YafY